MKTTSRFRLSRWVAGSLLVLILANFFLMLFVAGADVFFGQPPQLMVPLFALMWASGALLLSRKRRPQVESCATETAGNAETISAPLSRRQANVPAYLTMTITRRPSVMASTTGSDNWKGAI